MKRTVAIVGGGVSGLLTAYHLRRRNTDARIVIIERRSQLGLGLAYSTCSAEHLLNVPAAKISALPDDSDHFLRWLKNNGNPDCTGWNFAPRMVFGRYLQSLAQDTESIEHLQATATDCRVSHDKAELRLQNGLLLSADAVVLAFGNLDPAPLPGIACHSAWEPSTYANLPSDAPVILIGTGLTAIDVLLRLRELGHRGIITAVSRHGVLPHRHAEYVPLPHPALNGPAPTTTRELLRQLRAALQAEPSWRAVVDSLRSRTNEFWLALPLDEQKRFRRHLARRWEVVRHRMAPRIADQIERELAAGSLVKEAGSVQSIAAAASGDAVLLRLRTKEGTKEIGAARVINCTGPDMNYHRAHSPLLRSLLAQGLAQPGPSGIGLWSDFNGALKQADGTFSTMLFTIGPPRLGTLLESIAVPELRQQAFDLAAIL